MKILITYHSDTGNTEKVARSMKEGLEQEAQDVKLMPIKEIDPTSLKSYDLVILGSGIYGGAIGKSAKNLINKTTEFPSKFAFFCTHNSPKVSPKAFNRIRKTLEKNNSTIIGEFDCVGENLGVPKEIREKMMANLTPEKKKRSRRLHRKS